MILHEPRVALLTFAVSVILSSFLSRSLFPSHIYTHIYTHIRSYILAYFPLKSYNLQLLYNMTENTLDHDNTIIIVLCFLIFLLPLNFMYVFIFLILSIHLVFFLYASIIKHLCSLIVPRTTILLLLRFFRVFLDTYISTYV